MQQRSPRGRRAKGRGFSWQAWNVNRADRSSFSADLDREPYPATEPRPTQLTPTNKHRTPMNGSPLLTSPVLSEDGGSSRRPSHEPDTDLLVALRRVLALVESSTAQAFTGEEMELLQRLNALMNVACPLGGTGRAPSPQLHSRQPSFDNRRLGPDALRPFALKDLRQLARGPFKYQKMLQGNMLPEVLLAICLDLFSSTKTADELAMMVATHVPALLAADLCTLYRREEQCLVDLHCKRRYPVSGVVGFVACSGVGVRSGVHARYDDKFDAAVDMLGTAALLCPIVGQDGHPVAVLQVIRTQPGARVFSEDDQNVADIVACLLSYCFQYLLAVGDYQAEVEKNQMLLQAAAALASAEYDCDKVCTQILDFARTLCSADRCSLFLLDHAKQELEAYLDDRCTVRMPIAQGIAGHVATTGEPLNIADAYSDPRFNRNVDTQTGYRTRSILCMPIEFEGKIVAVAQLVNKLVDGEVAAFTQRDVLNFRGFAGYAATSLRNMRLFQIANHEYQRSESMLSLTYTLASATLDVRELANRVINSAKEVTGSDRCSLFIVNEKKQQLEAHFEDSCTLLMPIDEGIAGHVAITGESVNIPDAYQDPRFNQNVDAHTGYRTKSILCMPVMCGDTIVAVAQLVNKLDGGTVVPFTSIDEDTFLAFAVYAGVCIRTAILYNTSKQQQAAADLLLDLTKSLQSEMLSDGDQPVRVLMERAQAMAKAERCVVFYVAEQSGRLEPPRDPAEAALLPLAEHVLAAKTALAVEDITEDRRFCPPGETDVRSALCVPVAHQNGVAAVALLLNKRDGGPDAPIMPFEEEDEALLALFAQHAGVALRVGHLYDRTRYVRDRYETILRLANQLASSAGLDEASVIAHVIAEAPTVTRAEGCRLYLCQPHLQSCHVHLAGGRAVPVPLGRGLAHHVMQSAAPLLLPDVPADPRYDPAVDGAGGPAPPPRNAMGFPLRMGRDYAGALVVVNKAEGRAFTQDDLDLDAAFAEFAAMALANSHAAVQMLQQRHLSDVQARILGRLSCAPIKDGVKVMENVMEGAKELLGADRCTVFVVDRENRQLVSKVAQNVAREIRIPWDHGLAGKVARTGTAVNIPDAYQNADFNSQVDQQFGYRTKSILTMPIWHDGEVIGVTQVINKVNGGEFTAQDEQLLESFSMYAGIALANLRLYEFVVNAGQEATQLLELNKRGADPDAEEQTRLALAQNYATLDFDHVQRCRNVVLSPEVLAHVQSLDFNPLDWYQRGAPGSDERLMFVRLLAYLFEAIGVVAEFHVDLDILIGFLLQVQMMYRNVHYHNFAHAFDVTHFLFTALRCIGEAQGFTMLDKFAILVAGVIHDVDHMGLNNSFHLKCDTPMGILSSTAGTTSVLEVHHCNLAIQVLSIKEFNVFHSLTPEQSKQAYRTMVDMVLGTDMAHHGKLTSALADAIQAGSVPKDLLVRMLIKTADLSNTVKPFPVALAWAKRVTEEFFDQGDLEKERGLEVMAMFDRTKSGELAKGQIGFIDFVAKKHMELMASFLPEMQWLVDNLLDNRRRWQACLTPDPPTPMA